MSVAVKSRPELIVEGTVRSARPIVKKETGEVLGQNLTLDGDRGACYVTAWSDSEVNVQATETVALVVNVQEGRDGASLVAVRKVDANDLDRVAKAARVS